MRRCEARPPLPPENRRAKAPARLRKAADADKAARRNSRLTAATASSPLCGPLSPLPRRTASLGAKRARDAVREESRRNHMPPRRQAKRRACLCPSGFRPPPRMRHNANTSPLPISRRAKAPALPQKTARANKGTRRENGLTAAAKQSFALCSPTVPPFTSAYRCAQRKAGVRRFPSGKPYTTAHTAARSERPTSAGKQARESSRAAAKNGTQTKRCAGQRGFRRQGAAIQTRRHSADAGRADKRPDGKRAALRVSPI